MFVFTRLSAPGPEKLPDWRPVSFEIRENCVITKHGNYQFDNLPEGFLVYERKRSFGYEILLKEFKKRYIK